METEKGGPAVGRNAFLRWHWTRPGDHGSATEHFTRAYALGTRNTEIQQSEVLKKHLKM
jgi:hypothetical protein